MAFLPTFTHVGVFQGFMPAGFNRLRVPAACTHVPLPHTQKRLRTQVQIGWTSSSSSFIVAPNSQTEGGMLCQS